MLGVDGVRVDDDSDTGGDAVGLGQHCSTLGRGWRYKEDVLQCNVKMWHLIYSRKVATATEFGTVDRDIGLVLHGRLQSGEVVEAI